MRMPAPLAPGAPLGDVYFPNALRPMRADLLSRASWQLRTRGGADVFLRLPLDCRASPPSAKPAVPTLFADMVRYTAADGLAIEATADRPAHRRRPAGRHPRAPRQRSTSADARSVVAARRCSPIAARRRSIRGCA